MNFLWHTNTTVNFPFSIYSNHFLDNRHYRRIKHKKEINKKKTEKEIKRKKIVGSLMSLNHIFSYHNSEMIFQFKHCFSKIILPMYIHEILRENLFFCYFCYLCDVFNEYPFRCSILRTWHLVTVFINFPSRDTHITHTILSLSNFPNGVLELKSSQNQTKEKPMARDTDMWYVPKR